jgi:hypothetical protein
VYADAVKPVSTGQTPKIEAGATNNDLEDKEDGSTTPRCLLDQP